MQEKEEVAAEAKGSKTGKTRSPGSGSLGPLQQPGRQD